MNLSKNKKVNLSTVYAFIDAQNLNLGVKSQGWKLDWRKFRAKKDWHRRSVETLGLSSHRDIGIIRIYKDFVN